MGMLNNSNFPLFDNFSSLIGFSTDIIIIFAQIQVYG